MGGMKKGSTWDGLILQLPPSVTKEIAMFHGVAGELVRKLGPETEADPKAILVQFLVAFGNLIGRNAYIEVGHDRHFANLFCVLVGDSATGKKGTSWGHVKKGILPFIDEEWVRKSILSGSSSGEGVIHALRDNPDDDEENSFFVEKKLLLVEPEFGALLRNFTRKGNNLSSVLRNAWDDGDFNILTKNDPMSVRGAHVSMLGHITPFELKKDISIIELSNGFANRIIWIISEQSKSLPRGGDMTSLDFSEEFAKIKKAAEFGKKAGRIQLSEDAADIWDKMYDEIQSTTIGLYAEVTARSRPQVLRLALVYAILDCSDEIKPEHLCAARSLWDYSSWSSMQIFGKNFGDKNMEKLLIALEHKAEGLSRTEISEVFQRNLRKADIKELLCTLEELGVIEKVVVEGQTKPREIWRLKDSEK